MNETIVSALWSLWVSVIVPFVVPVVVLWAAARLRVLINSKLGESRLKTVMEFGIIAVEATEQEYVKQVKKANEDGIVTAEEHEIARNMAINRLQSLVLSAIGAKISNEDAKTVVEASLSMVAESDARRLLQQQGVN